MGALTPAIRYFGSNLAGPEYKPTPAEWIDPSAADYAPSIYSGDRGDKPLESTVDPKSQIPRLFEKIFATYSRISKDMGYSHVPIADLRDALGISQTALEQMIKRGPLKGKAVLAKGDWSLSNPHIRSGATKLGSMGKDDSPYLLIKLLKE